MLQLSLFSFWWRSRTAQPDLGARWHGGRAWLADNLGLVAGVLLLLCAALWAVAEHAGQKAVLRAAETNRYIAAFQDPPVADAWLHLTRTWQAERARQSALLERIAALSGNALARPLRHYRAFVIDTVADHRLARDIDTMLRFYRRLALCIRVGGCDPARAAGRFGSAAWSFRNQHYYYLLEVSRVDEIDRALDVIAPREDEAAGDPS